MTSNVEPLTSKYKCFARQAYSMKVVIEFYENYLQLQMI
jgi:hypothetical protein